MQGTVCLLCLETEATWTSPLTLHTRLHITSSRLEHFVRARPSTPGTPSTPYFSETGSLTTEIRSLGRCTTTSHEQMLITGPMQNGWGVQHDSTRRNLKHIKHDDESRLVCFRRNHCCQFSSLVQNKQHEHHDSCRNHFCNVLAMQF